MSTTTAAAANQYQRVPPANIMMAPTLRMMMVALRWGCMSSRTLKMPSTPAKGSTPSLKVPIRAGPMRQVQSAKARIRAAFTSSEGWKVMGPRAIQRTAPLPRRPVSSTPSRRPRAARMAGKENFRRKLRGMKETTNRAAIPMPA